MVRGRPASAPSYCLEVLFETFFCIFVLLLSTRYYEKIRHIKNPPAFRLKKEKNERLIISLLSLNATFRVVFFFFITAVLTQSCMTLKVVVYLSERRNIFLIQSCIYVVKVVRFRL